MSKGSRADNGGGGDDGSGPSSAPELHHGNCFLFTLIHLARDKRGGGGLTDRQGYGVIEDLGIDFLIYSRSSRLFLDEEKKKKETTGFRYPSNEWKMEQ